MKNKTQIKNEVGTYIIEEILSNVSKGKSPVDGQSWKASLSPKYAKQKSKISSATIANMELHGDMLDSLEFKKRSDGVEVGIFDYEQAQKADNHNKFSSSSMKTKVPKRQFIPKDRQRFKAEIMREVNRIIDYYKED